MIANATQKRESAALAWVVRRRQQYDHSHPPPAAPVPDHEYLWRPLAELMLDVLVLLDALKEEQAGTPPRVAAACGALADAVHQKAAVLGPEMRRRREAT